MVQNRLYDLSGDVLPPDDDGPRGLVPYQPDGIRVRLPEAQPAPTWEMTRHTAQRAPSLEADVLVPGAQALFTAVAVAIGSGLIALALEWSWREPAVITAVSFAGAWLWRLGVVTALLWRVESVVQRDLTGDGVKGKPQPGHAFTLVQPGEARATAAAQKRAAEDDARRAELLTFAHRSFTHGTSERAHRVAATGPDREKYLECRDTLLKLGLAAWRNPERPRGGWVMTTDETTATDVITRHVF